MVVFDRHCTACRLCIKECPTRMYTPEADGTFMAGIKANCVDCGTCLPHCPATAVDYVDDTERFIRDVRQGIPITLLAAPAVAASFVDYRRVFGYLQSLGVRSFHNVLLRADITIWAYIELLRRSDQAAFLSSPCAAVTTYIRQHKPRLKPHLMPVYSPLACTIVYLRKYRKLTDRIAFLSPCVAKRKEIQEHDPGGYNITINRLQQLLESEAVDLTRYAAVDFVDLREGKGLTLGIYGGISESIAAHLPAYRFVKVGGPDKVYHWLDEYERRLCRKEALPHLAELYNCRAGCEGGTGINERQKIGLAAIDTKWSVKALAAQDSRRCGAEQRFAVFDQTLELTDFIHC